MLLALQVERNMEFSKMVKLIAKSLTHKTIKSDIGKT